MMRLCFIFVLFLPWGPVFAQTDDWEIELLKHFRAKLSNSLADETRGCVDCHASQSMSNLVLSGEPLEDMRRLLDEGYLSAEGPDSLLGRIESENPERRMPKDAPRWTKRQVRHLKQLIKKVEQLRESHVVADEQFPRSLLGPYHGETPQFTPNQFISYRQLRAKIESIFQDNWIRGDRDLFEENIAAFGGADFKTRFNESTQPGAAYLSALENLSRDVANHAFRHASGPFADWSDPLTAQLLRSGLNSSDESPWSSKNTDLVSAINALYERILFRPASESDIDEAIGLLRSVSELQETISRRDTKLAFELVVRDPSSGLNATKQVTIGVSGNHGQLVQSTIDQRQRDKSDVPKILNVLFSPIVDQIASQMLASEKEHPALCSKIIGNVRLGENHAARLVMHNKGTRRTVSFCGVDVFSEQGRLVRRIRPNDSAVEFDGAWDEKKNDGLLEFNDGNRHKGLSTATVDLKADVEGEYSIAVLWKADQRNADNVVVELFGEQGNDRLAAVTAHSPASASEAKTARFFYDCGDDTVPYFELPASFQFDRDSFVQVSNGGTLDKVTVAAVDMINANDPKNNFLIDSEHAEGADAWEEFKGASFGAYNVRGKKLHDDNKRKGELSLKYLLSDRKDHGWREGEFYRVRIYYPGKRDHETLVPVEVFARQSSPIVRVTHPLQARSDSLVRLDASGTYTVQNNQLEFTWRQVSGPTVDVSDWHAPHIEFVAPRLDANQVAWTSLCAALLRHPDFLFTRPPSIENLEGELRERLLLVKVAMDLVGRPPSVADFARLKEQGLASITDDYLDSEEFRDFYFHRVRLYLESQGTALQDEPARLWSYVVFNDRPFQEILTANYTVDESFSTVERPEHHGNTGVLTTRGFIDGKPGLPHYNYAAQVSMLFLGYVYEVPPEIVEQREGVTALGTTDPNSSCYSCHKVLTPLAFQRLNWTDDGKYRTKDEDGLEIDATDRGAVSEYPFKGNGLEAFAMQAVKKERFVRTMIDTHVSFYFGRPMRSLTDERTLYKRLWDNVHQHEFQIRKLIRAIVLSPEYLGTASKQKLVGTPHVRAETQDRIVKQTEIHR